MADVVGTAYVRIRAITTGLGKDIRDSVEKGMDLPGLNKKIHDDVNKGAKKTGDDSGKSLASRMKEGFRKEMDKDGGKSFIKKMRSTFKIPGKFWLVGLGIPALGGALKIAGAYLTTLVGQLGFVVTAAVGAGAALVGAVGLGLLGVLPLILAFKTETEALDKFKESLEEQADAWKEVGAAVQRGLLPPLTEATQLLSSEFIPLFTELGEELGDIFGDIVTRIANVLTSTSAMESWGAVFESVAPFMRAIGDALVQIARLLPPLLEVTAPLAVDLAEAFAGMATNFANFITTGTASGTLSDNLSLWWDRAKLVGEVLWNLVEALWEIFRVGADVVSPQFENLRDITQGWVDFLRSPEGQDNLKKIFENALPVAQEVNELLGKIIEMILEPVFTGDTGGVISFLESLSDTWLPLLGEIASTIAETMGPNLEKFVDVFLELFTTLAEAGTLAVFLDVLGELVGVLTDLFAIPGMSETVAILLAAFGAFSAIMTVIGPALGAVTALMGLGLTLGPALAVVGGIIAALGAVFAIIANWDSIVDFFKNLWDSIMEFFSNLDEWAADVWDTITEFFSDLGDTISELPGLLWEWIQEAIPQALAALGRFVAGIFQFLGSLPLRLLSFLARAAVSLWQWIIDAIPKVLSFLGHLIGSIIGFLISLPARIIGFMVVASEALWSWIQEAVPKALEWLGHLIGSILGFLISLPGRIISATIKASQALWKWVKDAAPKVMEWLGNIATSIIRWFTDMLPKLIIKGQIMLTNFLKWIVDAVQQIPGKLAEFAGKVWTWVTDFLNELPGRLIAGRDKLIEMGRKFIEAIVDGLESALSTVWSWAGTFINSVIDGIIENAGWLAGPLRKLFGRGGGGAGTQAATASATRSLAVTGFSGLTRAATPSLALAGAGASANSALTSQTPRTASGVSLVVQIGERDITDIVDARISDNDLATSQALFVTRRG